MLLVKNLYKGYGKGEVLQDVSFQVDKGTIHGIIGENGSGKTTLIKSLAGIYQPDKGEVLLEGDGVYENNLAKEKIGYVADTNKYFDSYKIVQLAKFFAGMYPTFQMDDFNEMNKVFEIDTNKKMRQLSKGQQMRVSYMLNMAMNPKILVLDEPTSGLDVIAKKDFTDLLVANVEKRNMTVVISSHHLNELEKICDNVTVIRKGKVQISNTVLEAKQEVIKLQVVFPNGAPKELFHMDGILDYKNTGNIYTVIVSKKQDVNWMDVFNQMGAAYSEEIDVDLEEMFIYMNRGERRK
jgi:ABC-2 type transport system ATP-binding protein